MHYWWERNGVRFECTACGKCCGGEPGSIWVTPEEILRIAATLGKSESDMRNEYLALRGRWYSIREQENYDCVFLGADTRRCKIYRVRPLQCRLFPFWPSMLRDEMVWDFYATRCPGMNRGKRYSPEMLRKFLELPQAEFL